MNSQANETNDPMRNGACNPSDDIDAQLAQSPGDRFADLFHERIVGILKVLQDTAGGAASSAGAFSFAIDEAGKMSVSQTCGKLHQELTFTL